MKRQIRRQENRSGIGMCEICRTQMYLQTHHIRGRSIVNAEADYNKCDICPNCHTNVHRGDVIIEDWVYTTSGKELLWHRKGEASITGDDAIVHLL